MTRPKRIAIATFGRSDFSILRPLCELLASDPEFEIGLWVAGAHFEVTSGRTIGEVEDSGLPIWARMDCGDYDRSELGTVSIMAEHLKCFATEATNGPAAPDLLLILGDRFEAIAAGLAMVPVGVPVGHISGGSITEGAIDDTFRHCLTKISAIHFCDLPRFAQRIQLMGEPSDRIFTTGALGLDAFRSATLRPFDDFVTHFDFPGLAPGFALATLHPESTMPGATSGMALALVDALRQEDRQVVFTYPNADPGSDEIIDVIEAAVDDRRVFRVRGFGAEWFPTAMHHAGLMIGNSSGGIIEAASFGLPVIDIGDRQRGRDHGSNVLHCARDTNSILEALNALDDAEFIKRAAAPNPYGDGYGRERVHAALRSIDWSELAGPKRFADPDPLFSGDLMELRCA